MIGTPPFIALLVGNGCPAGPVVGHVIAGGGLGVFTHQEVYAFLFFTSPGDVIVFATQIVEVAVIQIAEEPKCEFLSPRSSVMMMMCFGFPRCRTRQELLDMDFPFVMLIYLKG